ncbi:MAG: carboxypeptidase-like regulatory domain-containing protein [Acidobacteria bacterium]|nr:carboxypeptidase-like regulatory domain-containing protein [Acidobacteriota bacterium]MCA1650804.1 carboxypeptidase-like regulatory domain-containing protein [Acidobacteriota bacterium]
MKRALAVVVAASCLPACGGSSPAAPAPPPAPTVVRLTGTVSFPAGDQIAEATITVLDGPNAGRSASTNRVGDYVLDGLTPGNANLSANATIYDEVRLGVFVNGSNTLNFTFSIPACRTNNTASVSFGNRSATTAHDVYWDGFLLFTLTPGQTSDPITVAALLQHTLQPMIANSDDFDAIACNRSTHILSPCERSTITCAGR